MSRMSRALAVAVIAFGTAVSAQSIRQGKTSGGIAYDVRGSGPVVVLLTGSNLDRIPGARIVRVAGGGHILNLTSPNEFQAAVSAFLGSR